MALAAVSISAGWLSGLDSEPGPSAVALNSSQAEPTSAPTSAPTPDVACGEPIESDPSVTCAEAIALARTALEADLPPIVGIQVRRSCAVALPAGVSLPPCTRTDLLHVTFTFADVAPRTITMLAPGPGESPRVVGPRPAISCMEPEDQVRGGIGCAEALEQATAALDADHPPILRMAVTRFCFPPGTCRPLESVLVEVTFDTSRPQVVRVWLPGTPEAWPEGDGVRGIVICPDEDLPDGLVLECRTAVDLVIRALERGHPPIEDVSLTRGCPPELGFRVDCATHLFGYVEVRYATTPSITVQYFVRGDREPAVVEVRRP